MVSIAYSIVSMLCFFLYECDDGAIAGVIATGERAYNYICSQPIKNIQVELSKQVCSLEQAKRLKELGIVQNSLYYFYHVSINSILSTPIVNRYNWNYGQVEENDSIDNAIIGNTSNEIYSAFTVAELGQMFGAFMDKNIDAITDEFFDKMKGKYGEKLFNCYNPLFVTDYILHVLENKHLTVAECNAALLSN